MNYYQETFNSWNKVAKLYEEKFMDFNLYNDTYDLFCKAITKTNPTILEIGCGPGNITKYLTRFNSSFKIHALDISDEMIQLAKKNNPKVQFSVMDCKDLGIIKDRFNGIICGFTIPYLTDIDCSKLLSNCITLLKDDGIIYLSFIAGDYADSGYISGSTGDRMHFHYHPLEKITEELTTNSFQIIHLIKKEFQRSNSTLETHTIVIAKKTNQL